MKAISAPRAEITLSSVVQRVLASGRITRADEKFFYGAMVADMALNEVELQLVNRVLQRLQMGLLKVVD